MRFQTYLLAILACTAAASVPASISESTLRDHDRRQSIIESKHREAVKKLNHNGIIKSHGHANDSTIPTTKEGVKPATRLLGPSTPTTKILGGSRAPLNQYPWFAALASGNQLYCGASLIDSQFVLTGEYNR